MPTKVVSRQQWENTMAFGIRSYLASTSACAARLVIARRALLGQAWQQLCRLIARSRRDEALDELGDWLLRDIGVIRERDIGVSRGAAAREADTLLWPH
jgi:uncharacterized protein YjiS (DUF1127 family)